MSVITFDFAETRRLREEFLIALAGDIRETLHADDPAITGPIMAADLIDCEIECQTLDAESLFSSYRFAVGAANGNPGEVINIDLYVNKACHDRALACAREYLDQVNLAFDLALGRAKS